MHTNEERHSKALIREIISFIYYFPSSLCVCAPYLCTTGWVFWFYFFFYFVRRYPATAGPIYYGPIWSAGGRQRMVATQNYATKHGLSFFFAGPVTSLLLPAQIFGHDSRPLLPGLTVPARHGPNNTLTINWRAQLPAPAVIAIDPRGHSSVKAAPHRACRARARRAGHFIGGQQIKR